MSGFIFLAADHLSETTQAWMRGHAQKPEDPTTVAELSDVFPEAGEVIVDPPSRWIAAIPYGWFCHANKPFPNEFPPDLAACFAMAHAQGYEYILFSELMIERTADLPWSGEPDAPIGDPDEWRRERILAALDKIEEHLHGIETQARDIDGLSSSSSRSGWIGGLESASLDFHYDEATGTQTFEHHSAHTSGKCTYVVTATFKVIDLEEARDAD